MKTPKSKVESTESVENSEPVESTGSIEETVRTRACTPGFSVDEAKELLGMCVVANYLGPVVFPPFPIGLRATSDPENPLPGDDGRTYPYPAGRIWPEGWTPGVPSGDEQRPWSKSIITSRLANGAPLNSAIIAWNASRNAYAIAFSGTLNPGAAMQDVSALLVPSGPVNLPYFKSNENYTSAFPVPAEPMVGGAAHKAPPQPPDQTAKVHLGYRSAVESLSVDPLMPANLKSILSNIEAHDIDLFVTGHSLGAAVAQLFSAWVRAGGVPSKNIHVKCYGFGTPKCSNTPMAANYALALGNAGLSYRVENTLDTSPQLPPTKEETTDLINPAISTDLTSKAEPSGLYASSPLAPLVKAILGPQPGAPASGTPAAAPAACLPFPLSIVAGLIEGVLHAASHSAPAAPPPSFEYVGMGVPHVLAAQYPVVYDGRFYPPDFFPARDPHDLVAIPDETTRQWWQHWPYSYAKYLDAA